MGRRPNLSIGELQNQINMKTKKIDSIKNFITLENLEIQRISARLDFEKNKNEKNLDTDFYEEEKEITGIVKDEEELKDNDISNQNKNFNLSLENSFEGFTQQKDDNNNPDNQIEEELKMIEKDFFDLVGKKIKLQIGNQSPNEIILMLNQIFEFSISSSENGIYKKIFNHFLKVYNFLNRDGLSYCARVNYNGAIFSGRLEKGEPNGFGRMEYHDQSLYIGFFTKGEKNLIGIFIDPNKRTKYFGEFKRNNIDGIGFELKELENNTRTVYYGNFENNLKKGKGIKVFSNFEIYAGSMDNNTMNGHGKIYYKNQGMYIGDFVNGVKQGQGTFHYENENYYVGKWENNTMNGFGKFVNKNENDVYEGSFKDGKFDGKIIHTKSDGRTYIEYWINGEYKQSEGFQD